MLSHKIRQRLERRAGAAETVDQHAKCARADIVAADELQPVEALFVGKANARHGDFPILPSVPAINRSMLGLCLNHSITASATNNSPALLFPIAKSAAGVATLAARAAADE